jgi:hypothetical protein
MDIEHCNGLSLFCDGRESHEQDGEMLPLAMASTDTASSDPAMASGLPQNDGRLLQPVLAAATLPLE